jgi:hypothetical protein
MVWNFYDIFLFLGGFQCFQIMPRQFLSFAVPIVNFSFACLFLRFCHSICDDLPTLQLGDSLCGMHVITGQFACYSISNCLKLSSICQGCLWQNVLESWFWDPQKRNFYAKCRQIELLYLGAINHLVFWTFVHWNLHLSSWGRPLRGYVFN